MADIVMASTVNAYVVMTYVVMAIYLVPRRVQRLYSGGVYSYGLVMAYVVMAYRADWEPATTSGKCMAGVPGVFWRSPAVLWGPTTHNPALFKGKPLF